MASYPPDLIFPFFHNLNLATLTVAAEVRLEIAKEDRRIVGERILRLHPCTRGIDWHSQDQKSWSSFALHLLISS